MILEKYSMGIGDRFSRQGKAQLSAIMQAKELGVDVVPVWNKSHREHSIVKTTPQEVRTEADEAISSLNWQGSYFVDADHINLTNVDDFLSPSDFFTIDVADFIGQSAGMEQVNSFVAEFGNYVGGLSLPGLDQKLSISRPAIEQIAEKYLLAVIEAGNIYRYIEERKGKNNFITEVSMDETDTPQTPLEMFFILAGLAREGIPVQTIAPKFTGRFNKGVDYVGDLKAFESEFNQDLAVIDFAVKTFGLPANLKLSIHSGSDKFSIYPLMKSAMKRFNAGLHLKTAGTTWLEELIGLAEAGGEGLTIAREIYKKSLLRYDELCKPYASVIDINTSLLPTADQIETMDSDHFVNSLRHQRSHPQYNVHLRQLLHVGYKIAAEMGERYYSALARYETVVARNVTENILERHIKQVFL